MSRGTAYYDLPNGERIELPTTMPDVEEVPGPLCDGKFELPEAVKEMQHFKRKPVFGGAFEVGYPRKWELSDDDMDHYYWGIVNLICKTPNALKNEEVEALI